MSDQAVAVAIGVAFGFALERAGLGNARKLAGQFLLRDFTVVKVMFTAILTAMLGIYWLGRLGLVDVSFLYVPETYLPAQIAGGVLFGAGFALAGLCPGTSCVSAATGRGDGLATVAGLFAGVTTIGLLFAPLQAFYERGGRGAWTLPVLLHLPPGVVMFLVVALALTMFSLAHRLETSPARHALTPLPSARQASSSRPPARQVSARWLGATALALGAAAAVDGLVVSARHVSKPAPLVRPHSGC